jgi:WhiB family redox-sensing transcriptional regulator
MSPHTISEPVTSNAVTSRPLIAVISPGRMTAPVSASTDRALWDRVARSARCADGGLDADEWFPISADAGMARQQAAAAIAVCAKCPVRGQCLALSLRHWGIGQHGVWGGLVAADRARLRARLRAGRTGGRGIAVLRDAGAAVVSREPGG